MSESQRFTKRTSGVRESPVASETLVDASEGKRKWKTSRIDALDTAEKIANYEGAS
jgi:hypothetical protein